MGKPGQIIVVRGKGRKMSLSCYNHTKTGYKRVIGPVPAFVGEKGVTYNKFEGDGKTPKGIYKIGFAFGFRDKVNTELKYRKIKKRSKWCCDSRKPLYNRWSHGEFDFEEFMSHYKNEYYLGCVIKYNYCIPRQGLGSAIFLHIGNAPTKGCVAVSYKNLYKIIRWLNCKENPHIYI